MGHPGSQAVCLPWAISDFPGGQFRVLIWAAARRALWQENPFRAGGAVAARGGL